jgi:hypothetical protein
MKTVSLVGIAAGFFGGLLGSYVAGHWDRDSRSPSFEPAATTVRQNAVSAGSIRLVDARGRLRAELAISADGGPALFFFDRAGRNRMVLGLYSPGEGEAPFVVLNDSQQHAAGIFRLFGAHETPVVVLKSQGRDRSIYGLEPKTLEPFLVNYSSDGRKDEVFGKY